MLQIDPNKIYPKETVSRSIIRFQDCDPLKHLNNAKYFDYFFNAREDQVPKLYGLNPLDIFQQFQAAWVVYNHQIAYVRSAMVGEWVTIYSRLIHYTDDTAVIEYVMACEEDVTFKSLLWTTLKYVDIKTGKKQMHHPEVMNYLKAIHYQDFDFEKTPFDERIKQISAQYKAKKQQL
ncbi:acyl-CoA thioesterase [Rhodoflexus caldus]|jgi:acyl-CoA thioester hydrolase|uniref:acyl-CoA thioesterase n=1 Tax=Rhodoflexus caldus TaxID=2891236 RepID=UPI00202A1F62|nr:acyl-CoA thioesterase [Rhodoflexus caldus]